MLPTFTHYATPGKIFCPMRENYFLPRQISLVNFPSRPRGAKKKKKLSIFIIIAVTIIIIIIFIFPAGSGGVSDYGYSGAYSQYTTSPYSTYSYPTGSTGLLSK